jgi:hypothetical protein
MFITRRRIVIALLALPFVGGAAAYVWRRFFSADDPEHAARVMRTVVDHLLPAGEFPGGVALGIDRRLEDLAAVSPKREIGQLRATARAGIEWLDNRARAEGAAGFLSLDERRQEGLMMAAFESVEPAGRRFMIDLRHRALSVYYSEPVIESRFAYTGPPQPAGFPDFEAPPQ